jgi:hypothetical protein
MFATNDERQATTKTAAVKLPPSLVKVVRPRHGMGAWRSRMRRHKSQGSGVRDQEVGAALLAALRQPQGLLLRGNHENPHHR